MSTTEAVRDDVTIADYREGLERIVWCLQGLAEMPDEYRGTVLELAGDMFDFARLTEKVAAFEVLDQAVATQARAFADRGHGVDDQVVRYILAPAQGLADACALRALIELAERYNSEEDDDA